MTLQDKIQKLLDELIKRGWEYDWDKIDKAECISSKFIKYTIDWWEYNLNIREMLYNPEYRVFETLFEQSQEDRLFGTAKEIKIDMVEKQYYMQTLEAKIDFILLQIKYE